MLNKELLFLLMTTTCLSLGGLTGCSGEDEPDTTAASDPTSSAADTSDPADSSDPSDESDSSDESDPTPPILAPLGMTLVADDITYVGTAMVDITPEIIETYTDVNGNHDFDGCFDDPTGERCAEPFDDVNGNGYFDAIFKGGFEPLHPAQSVSAPISTRAFIISHNAANTEPTRYFAWVTVDVVGLEGKRFWQVEEQFIAEGFAPDRLIVTATHNHQAPDTVGLWGDPINEISGRDPVFMERITESIEQAVREAAANMQPSQLSVATTSMEEQSLFLNGTKHGGSHPNPNAKGMLNDIRDPRIVSDRLLTLQANHLETGSTILTLTNWSGHPEVGGGNDDSISADWVGVTRIALEEHYGGMAIHLPEALGGMQSALFLDLPLINEQGVEQFELCTEADVSNSENPFDCFEKETGAQRIDENGQSIPQWATASTTEVIQSHGWHVAKAAIRSLETAEAIQDMYLDIDSEWMYVPVDNPIYNLIFTLDILELGFSDLVTDPALCQESLEEAPIGCSQARAFRARIGPLEFLTAPGEVTPEIAWGLPTNDPQFVLESTDVTARGPDAVYFVQHTASCNNVSFEECSNQKVIGECDCLTLHAAPYVLSEYGSFVPYMDFSEARYKVTVSMTDSYFSYVLPGPDIHHNVTVLDNYQGDHFEDTVTFSTKFSEKVSQAHQSIDARW
jgi:hypothetical protein